MASPIKEFNRNNFLLDIQGYIWWLEKMRQDVEEISEQEEELCFFYEGNNVNELSEWAHRVTHEFTLYVLPDQDSVVIRFYSKKDAAGFKFLFR